jgi:hypothetical protein
MTGGFEFENSPDGYQILTFLSKNSISAFNYEQNK